MKTYLNILVSNTNKEDLQLLENILKQAGYGVSASSDIQDTLEKIKYKKINIVLLDTSITFNDTNRYLKEIKKTVPETAVIMTTSFPSVETAVAVLREGARDYIKKPYSKDNIIAAVERIINEDSLISDIESYITSIVGPTLKRIRKSQKMTLKILSGKTGLSISLCSQVENGKVLPSLLTLYKITRGLNISLKEIFIDL